MKKSLKLFSFKTILTKAAYSSLKNTVFGIIAVKLATVVQRSVILIWWYFRTKGWLSTLSPLPQQHLQSLHGDLNSQEKQDVGQRRIGLNNLKIMVQIWNVTACSLSTSQRRNGTFIGTEPSGRLSLSYSLDIVSTIRQFMLPEMTKGHPKHVIYNLWSLSVVPKILVTTIGWYLRSCDLCTRMMMVDKVSVFTCMPPTVARLNYLTGLLSPSLCTCTVLSSIYCQNPFASVSRWPVIWQKMTSGYS